MLKATQFQKTILTFMNSLNFNQHEIEAMKNKFQAVDENNDGSLSIEEIRTVMTKVMSDVDFEKFKGVLLQMDADANGNINYSEFLVLLSEK